MPHIPKINIQELKKKGHLDEKVFYRLLGEQCNYLAPEAVKTFYLGLVHHLTSELKKNGVVRMPLLGDMYLLKQKDTYGWKGKVQGEIRGRYMLKFKGNEAWREYFTKLAERDGAEGKLDPREKLLGQVIDPTDHME